MVPDFTDVALVSLGTTPGLRRADAAFAQQLRHAGLGCEVAAVEIGAAGTLRRNAAITDLVEELSPVASRLGCLDELRSNLDVLEHGPSYLRQRRVVEAGGSTADVVDLLVRELESDRPTPA